MSLNNFIVKGDVTNVEALTKHLCKGHYPDGTTLLLLVDYSDEDLAINIIEILMDKIYFYDYLIDEAIHHSNRLGKRKLSLFLFEKRLKNI